MERDRRREEDQRQAEAAFADEMRRFRSVVRCGHYCSLVECHMMIVCASAIK